MQVQVQFLAMCLKTTKKWWSNMENYEELEPLIIEQDGELIANPEYENE